MDENTSWSFLTLMSVSLGIRHGFDLDHLATIDAIARTIRSNRSKSKVVGFLFSLGHGIVVTTISLIIGAGLIQSHIPVWLDGFGKWISILFLLFFGALNLYDIFQHPTAQTAPIGIKGYLIQRITPEKCSPFLIVLIGALFALSFDTFSQVALFSLSASLLSGWLFSGILGLLFMLGMMISDGINGLVISTLIQRADSFSMVISRGLGLTICTFSLILGFMGLYEILFSS